MPSVHPPTDPPVVYDLYGRESPSNAAGRAEDEGRETPFDTQFGEMHAHVAARGGRIGLERRDVWWRDDIWGRPGLDDIREHIRQHKCDVLLVHAPERLATKKQLGYLLAECELHGVRVEYVHGLPFDPSDPASGLLQAAYEFAADWEHARTRERTQRGLRTVLAAGRPMGTGRVRYGLVWRTKVVNPGAEEERRIKIGYDAHPEKAKVVARLFRRALEGATCRAQVEELYREGVRSPTGKARWTPTVVRNILRDDKYVGVVENLRWKRTKARTEKGGRMRSVVTARPAAERQRLAADTAPPLVDEDVFAAVQAILSRNQAEASRRSRWPDATPLRGFAFCANCGRRLYVHPVPRKKTPWLKPDDPPGFVLRCLRRRPQERAGLPAGPAGDAGYGCVNWAHTDLLEEEVWESLMAALERPAAAAQAGQAGRAAPDAGARAQADADAVGARLAGLERRLALRERQLLKTDPDAEPDTFALFKTDLDRLRADHAAAQRERDDRAAALDRARADGAAWDALRHRWGDALRAWPDAERATAFRALKLVVRVWPDDPARRPPGADRWEADVELGEVGLGPAGVTRLAPPDFARGDDIVSPTRTSSHHYAALAPRLLTLAPAGGAARRGPRPRRAG